MKRDHYEEVIFPMKSDVFEADDRARARGSSPSERRKRCATSKTSDQIATLEESSQ